MALDSKTIKKQKELLLKEKKRIEEKIKTLATRPDYGFDEEDNIRELVDYENNMPIKDELSGIVEKIDKALAAIEAGTYGQCLECKKAIEDDRIAIMPYADICVSCQKK